MKAIKAATDPGDIARNESGSTILYNEHGCGVHIIHSDGSLQTDINLLNIDGDDWTPLCPAVDMRNTEREKELQDRVADLNDHLKGHIHTIQELEAKVRELEEKLETCRKYISSVDEVVSEKNKKLRDMQAELFTLREQSKWELGEPLGEGALLQPHALYWEVHNDGGLVPRMCSGQLLKPNGRKFYLDPRPLPTLPEPVPEVPKFKGAVRNVVTGKIYYVLWPKGARPSLVSPDGHTLHYDGFPPNNHELYNHPEVPNTPELIAALEKKST